LCAVFDGDVFQFTGFKDGFKDVAAFDAFYKLSVLFPGYDLHTWMLTGFPLGSLGRRRVWNHKSGLNSLSGQEGQLPEIAGILDLPFRLSSPIFPLAGHSILRKGPETRRLNGNFGLQSTTSEQAIWAYNAYRFRSQEGNLG